MRNIYTSVDIGTDTIKVIVSELYNGKLNLLASSSTKSKGIKKGMIIDMDEALTSLKMAISEVEAKLNIKIHNIIAVIPSYSSEYKLIKGSINIKDIVTKEDIIEVLNNGVKIDEVNMEMLTIIPINFSIDGTVIKEPLGKMGSTLESKAILATTPKRNIYTIMKLFEKCELEVQDISNTGISDMAALKSNDFLGKVGVIVNIGSDITTISLYNKSIIIKDSILEIGGKTIDNDISYIYKTSMYEAKKVKERFAIASIKHASTNDIYDLISENGKVVKVTQREVSQIVVARLEEILKSIKRGIQDLTDRQIDYIIFTGGVSNMPYLDSLIEYVFGSTANVAKINIVGMRNNKYTSSLGSIVYYINKQKLVGEITGMLSEEDIDNLTSYKKNILSVSNESMLGKVASYFFGE